MLPLWRELELSVPFHRLFPAFLGDPFPMFLESSLVHARLGRYSYMVSDPFLVIQSKNGMVRITGHGVDQTRRDDPFQALRLILSEYETENIGDLPPFQGGAVGYFGYDLAHHTERLPRTTMDDVAIPDLVVGLYDWTLAHDHGSGRSWIVSVPAGPGGRARAEARMEEVAKRVLAIGSELEGDVQHLRREDKTEVVRGRPTGGGWDEGPLRIDSNFTRDGYIRAVQRAKEYIAAGDIYQVNLSQRLRAPLGMTPWKLYCRLRDVGPVPYGAFLGLGDFAVVSASPELFLRKDGRDAETRPIKGTRPRGSTPEMDRQLSMDLLGSAKDRAENVMIVDLMRNDLGKVCEVGSVSVPELYSLESYSTVHHLVSSVVGRLEERHDAVTLLKACFPGGSITGCPKIRAMEIIDELEPTQRGVYCGSIGFVGFNGKLDTSIVIRTAVAKGGNAYFQVGGAIVADSDPDDEYQETLDKARAMLLALGGKG